MRPSNAPITAIPIPPPGGPFPGEQLGQIDGIKTEVGRENTVWRTNWQATCHDWTAASLSNRDRGIPLAPKPSPFVPQVVNVALDTDQAMHAGLVWLWLSEGTPEECPDLPAIVARPDNHIHIGTFYYGNFWKAADDNTFNDDSQDVPGTSDDGKTGLWRFIGSPMGKGRGWYQKK